MDLVKENKQEEQENLKKINDIDEIEKSEIVEKNKPPKSNIIDKKFEDDLVQENKIQPKSETIIKNDGSMYDQLRQQLDVMRIHLGNKYIYLIKPVFFLFIKL